MRQPKSRPLLAFHDRQLTDRREAMLLSLYLTLIHFGGIIVPPGYTDPCKFVDGNPYGRAWSPRTTTSTNSTKPLRTPSSTWRVGW
jgi:hypothetical protein